MAASHQTRLQICTAARKDEALLAYRVAIPRRLFEVKHGVLHQMTQLVEVFVVVALNVLSPVD